jgi:hypothetical protein
VPDEGVIAAMADDPHPAALSHPAADACRAPGGAGCGRWRCRVGWLVYLLVAVAVIAAFGAGAG